MKAQLKIKVLLVAALGILSLGTQAQAMKIGASADYPVSMGTAGQGFKSNVGASLDFYLDPILDPKIDNFLSVGYRSFTVLADGESAFRVIPILVGLELPAKISNDFKLTLAGAAGGSLTYFNTPNLNSIQIKGYFTAQVRPGIDWNMSQDFALRAQMPVTFLVGSSSFNFISYTLGLQYDFGSNKDSRYQGRQ